jgi:hypothetical protein
LQKLKALRDDVGSALPATDITVEFLNLYLPERSLPAHFTDAQLSASLTCLERLGCVVLGAGTVELDRFLAEFVALV